MLELGNASDSSDEYETSSVDVPKSPSCDPDRLKGALIKLAETFGLNNEQIEALPALSEVSLIEQDDSHLIFSEKGYRDAHAFKLYVGDKKWAIDGKKRLHPAFAYLFKKASKRKDAPFKMQICNGSIGEGHWLPIEAKDFGDVSNLAFPFNGKAPPERRVAVAQFYFQLGFEAGLYRENPGFPFTETWVEHLHAACNDLLDLKRQAEADEHASSTAAAPFTSSSGSSESLIRRIHKPDVEQTNKTMTEGGKKQLGALHNSRNRFHSSQDPWSPFIPGDTRPFPLSEASFMRAPIPPKSSILGYGQASYPGGAGATPFPITQAAHHDHRPLTSMAPYTQDPKTSFGPQPSLTGQSKEGVRPRRPKRSEILSKSPGLVPNIVEPRQGSSVR
jgi:hypothetical protein